PGGLTPHPAPTPPVAPPPPKGGAPGTPADGSHGPQGPPTVADSVVAVGSTLDAVIHPGNLAGPNVVYVIAPQPLPANARFNRGTGELTFVPAPGQAGHYSFTVTA